MNKYDSILKMFATGDVDDVNWVCEPSDYGTHIIATDKQILVRVAKSMCNEQYVAHTNHPDNVDRVFPAANCAYKLNIDECFNAIKRVPDDEIVTVNGIAAQCEECHGYGYVTWEYTDRHGETHEHEDECPLCDGRGKITERRMRRNDRNIGINGVCVRIGGFVTILHAINELGHCTATVQRCELSHAMRIAVEPGVEMLIMPNTVDEPACEITLKPIQQ